MKDLRITELIAWLESEFGADSFLLRDHWPADECAIGFADFSGSRMLYVNTFGKAPGVYHVALEDLRDPFTYKLLEQHDAADLELLRRLFREQIAQRRRPEE